MAIPLVSNGVLDAAGAAAFTALIVQQTKFIIEYWVKPENENHDNLIRLYVNAVAIAIVLLAGLFSNTLNVHSGADWFTAVVQGFGVAIAAIAGYHLLNGMTPQTAVQSTGSNTVTGSENATGQAGASPVPPPVQSITQPATDISQLVAAVTPSPTAPDGNGTGTPAPAATQVVTDLRTLASLILQARDAGSQKG